MQVASERKENLHIPHYFYQSTEQLSKSRKQGEPVNISTVAHCMGWHVDN